MPLSISLVLAVLFGLSVGSFLNVVIHRVPRGESIVFPGSRCPACGDALRAIDNVPVLSYLLLRGRCRACGAAISLQYPAVELLTAALFAGVALQRGIGVEAGVDALFGAAMIALIFIDARHQLLPNLITYPTFLFSLASSAALGAVGREAALGFHFSILLPDLQSTFSAPRAALVGALLLASAAPGLWLLDRLDPILFGRYFEWEEIDEAAEPEEDAFERRTARMARAMMLLGLLLALLWAGGMLWGAGTHARLCEDAYDGLLQALWGALVGGGVIWWMRTFYFFLRGVEGMGLGDVKMMCGVGALLGWYGAFGVLLIGSILGAVAGLALAVRRPRGEAMKTALPFGVCLGIAAILVMLSR